MDWYSWLCRAGLHPDVAFEYALLFARNGLAAADLRHLDHHALAAIGVPVAKHRIHILSLAKRDAKPPSSSSVSAVHLPWRATVLLAAAARSFADRLLSVTRRDKAAVAVAPRPLWKSPRAPPPPSAGRRGGNKKMALLMRQLSKPMLTNYGGGGKRTRKTANGSAAYKAAPAAATAITGCFANADANGSSDEDDAYDGEDMRWESMFQDLNPT